MVASLLIVGTIGLFRRYIPLSSALIAFFRGLVGSAALAAFLWLRGKGGWRPVGGRKLAALALNGLFLSVNWILLFEAFNRTTVAKATLCHYLQPTIVLLLSPLVFGERLTRRKLLCAAVALAGMALVSGIFGAEGGRPRDLAGILFGLGAACFYALVIILNKKIIGVDPWQKTVVQLFCAAATLVPYLLLNGDFRGFSLDGRSALLLLIVCVVHTGLAYALYFGSMDGLRAQTISALSYIDPIVAMLVSALALREGVTVQGVVGAVMILGATLISEREPV